MPTIANSSESTSEPLSAGEALLAVETAGESNTYDFPFPPPEKNSLPLLQRILVNRGLNPEEVFDTNIKSLPAADDFPAIGEAIPFLSEALDQPILVVGDYDVDGICSTATTVLALRSIGAKEVSYKLPNRYSGGYGLSAEMLAEITSKPPYLLITVDHGTNAWDQFEPLLQQGIRVLVIDHHQPGNTFQLHQHENFRLVNPQMPDCRWSEKNLCAAAVAFFVLAAVRNHLVEQGQLADSDDNKPGRLLDMVALATIGDQMPMSKTNRILVEQGLRRIRAGRCRPGIKRLLQNLRVAQEKVYSRQLSHTLIPRLNAAGRVRSADIAVDCLLAETLSEAHTLAQELIDLNHQRKELEKDMTEEIERQVNDIPDSANLLCFSHPEWSIGVVGIGASRLSSRLKCPVMVFALHPHRDEWVGSGRTSNSGENLLSHLHAIAEQEPDIFVNYGGHHQAVGATIKAEKFARFKELLAEIPAPDTPVTHDQISTDGELNSEEITLGNAEWLSSAVAWGKDLPLPRFEGVFEVGQIWRLSGNHIRLELALPNTSRRVQAIRFYCNAAVPEPGQSIKMVYELNSHYYRGTDNLQLIGQHWEIL